VITVFRLRLLIAASVVLPVLAGCSANKAAPARISGSISYKGQPIKAGAMAFHTSGGTAYPAQISPDGTYTATDIPEGELIVTIETESINPDKKKAAGKDAEKRSKMMQSAPGSADAPTPMENYLKIPVKYANAKTSPLAVTLTKGRQVHNFDLTD
jgi:hypothetical protein